jgi:proline iminopeptidase
MPRLSIALVLAFLVAASVHAAPPPETGRMVQAGEVSLYVETLGNPSNTAGTPLVVANGGPGFDHNYLHVSNVWTELAKHRPVVLYDQRGTGRSTAGKEPGKLADQIADLEAVRQHLGAAKIDLLGHSWGGYLVMAYAARHPEHIRKLMIVDSAAPRWSDTLFLFKEIFPEGVARQDALAFAAEIGDEKASAASMREYFQMLFYAPENRDAFLAASSDFHYSLAVNQALNADLARFDLGPELAKLDFPVLVATGRFDINVAPATAYRIHKAVPGSRFTVFEKSGHMPFFEEPALFIQVIEDFLR